MMIALEPGRGHSTTAASTHAMSEYGVHEKDMPPGYIVHLAREAGFRRHLVLPRPHELVRLLYRPAYAHATGQFDLRARHLLAKLRLLRLLFRHREPPLVLLWK